jgi:hypothetical protein
LNLIFYEQVPCFQDFSQIGPDHKHRNPLIPDILSILICIFFGSMYFTQTRGTVSG